MNNMLSRIAQLARGGGDPMAMLSQMAGQDPQAAQAMRMLRGKSPQQLKQMALNMCKERGTTPEAVLQELGLR